jgi:hypothetical protein
MPQFLVHLPLDEWIILRDYYVHMDADGIEGSIIYDVISQLVSDEHPVSTEVAIAGGYYES